MNNEPLLTVIIPVYNVSNYLRQCLDSVAEQTLKDIQVICVDDGSTDGSDDIVLEYAEKDPRFMLVRQKNCGAGTARNNGLKYAKGKYVHYLDSDDWLDLDAYRMVVEKLERYSCDCCFFQKYNYDNVTGDLTPTMRAFPTNDYLTSFDINPSFFIYNVVVPWNKVTRREIIVANNMQYDEIACANDRTFYFSLIKSCKSILVTRDNLIYYRINNSGSLIGTNRSIHYDAHFSAYDSTMAWYKDSDDTLKRMIADVCVTDFFNFFDKAANIYKVRIYRQLHEFFNRVDFSFFNDDFSPYAWGERMQFIRDHRNGTPEFFKGAIEQGTVVPVCREDLKPKFPVIVSLTSYPARIATIHLTIRSIMLDQSVLPDRTILWLSEEQFPNKENDLPYQLLDLRNDGLEIRFVEEDLKPHKKYFYTMQENPEAAVITVDDDVIYWPDTIECLLRSYKKHPRCVSGMRVHRMTFTDGKVNPYEEWDFNDDTLYDSPTMTAMATGVGGILYPPHLVPADGFDRKAIIKTCLRGDDLWLKVQEVRNNVPTVLATFNRQLMYIDGTQETALWKTNKGHGENDSQMNAILEHYHDRVITDRIYREFPGVGVILSVLVDCQGKDLDVGVLKELASKLPKNMDIVCFNVLPSKYNKVMSDMSFAGKVEIIPSKTPVPLYFAAKSAIGKYVLTVPVQLLPQYIPILLSADLKDPGHDQYDIIPGAGSDRAFEVGRSFLLRRNLADSMFYHLSDRLTTYLYRYGTFKGDVGDRDVRPEFYNGLFLNNLRSSYPGLDLGVTAV
ncbi:MAG: glycosyltransferase, partial [archaeon]|nr:glycosyltransferase [archaeon]